MYILHCSKKKKWIKKQSKPKTIWFKFRLRVENMTVFFYFFFSRSLSLSVTHFFSVIYYLWCNLSLWQWDKMLNTLNKMPLFIAIIISFILSSQSCTNAEQTNAIVYVCVLTWNGNFITFDNKMTPTIYLYRDKWYIKNRQFIFKYVMK